MGQFKCGKRCGALHGEARERGRGSAQVLRRSPAGLSVRTTRCTDIDTDGFSDMLRCRNPISGGVGDEELSGTGDQAGRHHPARTGAPQPEDPGGQHPDPPGPGWRTGPGAPDSGDRPPGGPAGRAVARPGHRPGDHVEHPARDPE